MVRRRVFGRSVLLCRQERLNIFRYTVFTMARVNTEYFSSVLCVSLCMLLRRRMHAWVALYLCKRVSRFLPCDIIRDDA